MAWSINGDTQAKIFFGISVAGVVLTTISGFSESMFPSYVSAVIGNDIIKTAGILSTIIGAIVGLLGKYSSSVPGSWAPQDTPVVKAATALSALPDDVHPDAVKRAVADLNEAVKVEVGNTGIAPPIGNSK
jgi:hypothetical protein